MKDRKFAILCWNDLDIDVLATALPAGSKIHLFFKHGAKGLQKTYTNIDVTELSEDINTEPKARNFIAAYYKTDPLHASTTSFLHVLYDATKILKDPSDFIAQIEVMMQKLDYPVWFSTCTDPCNYVYMKYNPRLQIVLDNPETKAIGIGSSLLYTSHSNTHWIIYDMEHAQEQLLKFDEDFTIPMFWIIEFLARRRNTKAQGQLFYMNQYLTIDSELGTFEPIALDNHFSEKTMKEEDLKFKEKKVAFAPDNNIDVVLEETYSKLK